MSRLISALAFAALMAFAAAINVTNYHVSDVKLDFTQAFVQCKRYGWTLATERTPEATQAINDALASAAGDSINMHHFIGGFQEKGAVFNPTWIWVDNGKDFDYTNWVGGKVSTTYECLLKLSISASAGQWSSAVCSTPFYFICESESD